MRHAGGGDDDLGFTRELRQVPSCGVAQSHCRVLRPPGEQQPERPADRDTTADQHDLGTRDLHLVAAQQMYDAARGARQRGGLVEYQPAEVGRMQPVGVLAGIDAFQCGVLVEVLRQRQLHDVAGALGVGVELVDGLVELGLADVGGQIAPYRVDAHLRTVGVLAPHVRLRAGVVADQHCAQARRASLGGQRRNPFGEVDEDLVTRGLAVQCDRTHGSHCGRLPCYEHSAQCVHPGQARPGDAAQPDHQGGDVRGVHAERTRHRRPDRVPPAARSGRCGHDDGRLPGGDTRRPHPGKADLVASRGDPRTAPADRRHPCGRRCHQRTDRDMPAQSPTPARTTPKRWPR